VGSREWGVGEEIQTPCREIPISLRINLLNVSHIEVRLSAAFPVARDILETLDCFIVIRIPQRLGLTRRRHQEQNQNQDGFFHHATFRFLAAAIRLSNSGRKCRINPCTGQAAASPRAQMVA